jgi:predicted NAD/FAD-dependent oxidoreductase
VTVIVVGAGIAGLACARELLDAGVPTRVVEGGRVVGGRLASACADGRYADIGAGYLTADEPAFRGRLDSWRISGLARPWTDTFDVYEGAERTGTTTGPMRWVAPGGLRGLAEDLARELEVTLEHPVGGVGPGSTVDGPNVDGVAADAVVLAMPGPQALRVLGEEFGTLRAVAGAQRWSPVLAAVLTYPERSWRDFHAAFVNGAPVLEKVFDDGDRRSDRAPVLVAHSTAGFARQLLDHPDKAANEMAGDEMAAAVSELLGVPAGRAQVHRWTYAQPAPGEGRFAEQNGVYLAGDAFGRPRVQTAWNSGRAVARAIIAS